MKKILACLLLVASVFMLQTGSASAAVDTCTWTGAASSSTLNGGNWSGCDNGGVPQQGDSLTFPTGPINKTVVFDLASGMGFQTITFADTGYNLSTDVGMLGNSYQILGSIQQTASVSAANSNITTTSFYIQTAATIHVAVKSLIINQTFAIVGADLTAQTDAGTSLVFDDDVNGPGGGIIKTGTGELLLNGDNGYTGDTTINAGLVTVSSLTGLGSAAGLTQVASGASLVFDIADTDATITEPLTLDGAGYTGTKTMEVTGDTSSLTLSGAIILDSSSVTIGSDRQLTLSGIISDGAGAGGFTFSDLSGSGAGKLTLTAANTYTAQTVTGNIVTINGNQPSSAILIVSGSTLKGGGTVGAIMVQSGGHVAPGNSPGCLVAGNTAFVSGSSFDVEIAGATVCTEYDQLQITGTIDLGGTTLNTALLNSYVPAVGAAFTIVSNDGADAVTGTFNGLAEGATFTAAGVTYKVSYVGGDGNDVVLTVQSVSAAAAAPGTPDTGFGLVAAHPAMAAGVTTIAALAMLFAARRLKPAAAKR